MKRGEVLQLYDNFYAEAYNGAFIFGDDFKECVEYEAALLDRLLPASGSWLDVACGTGYFLSRFPRASRAGLDISPAMLAIARRANPDVPFREEDFRVEVAAWTDRWHLVSCMGYAYCYADSVSEIHHVIRNLAAWTSPTGTCFMPVCDPDVLCKTRIPYRPPADSEDGRLEITAVVWNWIDEPSGKPHEGLVAPHLDHLVSIFSESFSDVELISYPRFERDCLAARRAIIAKNKRIDADSV